MNYVRFAFLLPFALLTLVLWAVLGLVLAIPLLVRALLAYSSILLLHAIVGRPVRGSTAALEQSIVYYPKGYVEIFRYLGNTLSNTTTSSSSSEDDSEIHFVPGFWNDLFNFFVSMLPKAIWAAIFWALTFFWLQRYEPQFLAKAKNLFTYLYSLF